MLELFLTLLEKISDLAAEREKRDRLLIEDHIEPAFKEFQDLHRKYLESFQSILERLELEEVSSEYIEDLIEKLKRENIFTEYERASLIKQSQELSDIEFRGYENTTYFFQSILYYITETFMEWNGTKDTDNEMVAPERMPDQQHRNRLIMHLRYLLEKGERYSGEFKDLSIQEIEGIVAHLQIRATHVSKQYFLLKREMLS